MMDNSSSISLIHSSPLQESEDSAEPTVHLHDPAFRKRVSDILTSTSSFVPSVKGLSSWGYMLLLFKIYGKINELIMRSKRDGLINVPPLTWGADPVDLKTVKQLSLSSERINEIQVTFSHLDASLRDWYSCLPHWMKVLPPRYSIRRGNRSPPSLQVGHNLLSYWAMVIVLHKSHQSILTSLSSKIIPKTQLSPSTTDVNPTMVHAATMITQVVARIMKTTEEYASLHTFGSFAIFHGAWVHIWCWKRWRTVELGLSPSQFVSSEEKTRVVKEKAKILKYLQLHLEALRAMSKYSSISAQYFKIFSMLYEKEVEENAESTSQLKIKDSILPSSSLPLTTSTSSSLISLLPVPLPPIRRLMSSESIFSQPNFPRFAMSGTLNCVIPCLSPQNLINPDDLLMTSKKRKSISNKKEKIKSHRILDQSKLSGSSFLAMSPFSRVFPPSIPPVPNPSLSVSTVSSPQISSESLKHPKIKEFQTTLSPIHDSSNSLATPLYLPYIESFKAYSDQKKVLEPATPRTSPVVASPFLNTSLSSISRFSSDTPPKSTFSIQSSISTASTAATTTIACNSMTDSTLPSHISQGRPFYTSSHGSLLQVLNGAGSSSQRGLPYLEPHSSQSLPLEHQLPSPLPFPSSHLIDPSSQLYPDLSLSPGAFLSSTGFRDEDGFLEPQIWPDIMSGFF